MSYDIYGNSLRAGHCDAKLSSQTAVDEAAAREIERLRSALEEIVDIAKDGISANSKWCEEIAREALKDGLV